MKGYWYCFSINGKKRLIPIIQYQDHKNLRLHSKNLGSGGIHLPPPPPSVDVLQKNDSGRRGLIVIMIWVQLFYQCQYISKGYLLQPFWLL